MSEPVPFAGRATEARRLPLGYDSVMSISGATGATPPLVEMKVQPITSLADVDDEWRALAVQSANLFATWEWADVWWRHFGHGRRLRLAACRAHDGRAIVILPLYSWRTKPLHVLRFLGHGPGDQLGPIFGQDDLQAAQLALRSHLDGIDHSVFLGEHLAEDQGWETAMGARRLSQTGAPVLRFHGRTWDEIVQSRSANFRQQLRRRERALARAHDVRFSLAEDPQALPKQLDVLFALHAERWGSRSKFMQAQAFHCDFAATALANGWLRLWIMELDGVPAAAWYGFRFAGAESYYQGGWGSRWERSSVGSVLLAHTIREAAKDGMAEYRFLQGDEAYKYRFADEHARLDTVVRPHGLPANVAVAAAVGLLRTARARHAVSALLGRQ